MGPLSEAEHEVVILSYHPTPHKRTTSEGRSVLHPTHHLRLSTMSSFTEVPILDVSLAKDSATKPAFLEELRKAVLEVGFLYIKNTGVDAQLVEDVIRLTKEFFELPMEEKLRLEMKNCSSSYPSSAI